MGGELFGRSLRDRSANLEYSRRNDDLYDSVRQCLGRPLASGPTVFAFARPDGVPGIMHAGIGMEFRNDDVLLKAQLGVSSNAVKLINDLLADPPAAAAWPTRLPPEVAGVVAVQDKALGRIIGTLGNNNNQVGDVLKEVYGGFLWTLRDSPALSRVVMAITGYRDLLPEVLTGIWGDQELLESELQKLQIKFRHDRDIEILKAAKLTATDSSPNATSTPLPEPFSTFGRYTPGPDGNFNGEPTAEDFANETYTVQVEGHTIHYVAPRLTANDRRFRKKFEKLSDAELRDNEDLDRYRIAYISYAGATWMATDVHDLRALLTRKTDDLGGNSYFTSSTRGWRAGGKVQIFLNVDQISKFGLLNPESALEDFVKDYLLDLREHPAITADLHTCAGRRGCLSVSVRLGRRAAIQ